MNLSASAIINGLTMLRAYDSNVRVSFHIAEGHAIMIVRGVKGSDLHVDDLLRMTGEGWRWNEPEQVMPEGWWSLCE